MVLLHLANQNKRVFVFIGSDSWKNPDRFSTQDVLFVDHKQGSCVINIETVSAEDWSGYDLVLLMCLSACISRRQNGPHSAVFGFCQRKLKQETNKAECGRPQK